MVSQGPEYLMILKSNHQVGTHNLANQGEVQQVILCT